jgi:protein-disulfide isomerase
VIFAVVGKPAAPAADASKVATSRPPLLVPTEPVPLAASATLGSDQAPVIVMVFSEFECPFCKRFAEENVPKFKVDYLDTGKAQLVFRHLPLRIHPTALLAAQGAECARRQNQFWPMHDLLFGKPKETPLTPQVLNQLAQKAGLAPDDFDRCVAQESALADVKRDEGLAATLGITGTPAFFVGRREGNALRVVSAHRGLQTPERLGAAVEAAAKK